jgi:hypothetical protein
VGSTPYPNTGLTDDHPDVSGLKGHARARLFGFDRVRLPPPMVMDHILEDRHFWNLFIVALIGASLALLWRTGKMTKGMLEITNE